MVSVGLLLLFLLFLLLFLLCYTGSAKLRGHHASTSHSNKMFRKVSFGRF